MARADSCFRERAREWISGLSLHNHLAFITHGSLGLWRQGNICLWFWHELKTILEVHLLINRPLSVVRESKILLKLKTAASWGSVHSRIRELGIFDKQRWAECLENGRLEKRVAHALPISQNLLCTVPHNQYFLFMLRTMRNFHTKEAPCSINNSLFDW